MTTRLSTTVSNIQSVANPKNANSIIGFFEFMKRNGTTEGYQNNNLKTIIAYCKFLGSSVSLEEVNNKIQITSFLDSKIKTTEQDPDKRWITTWNDYLGRIKFFFRWLHNSANKEFDDVEISEWRTPDFVSIRSGVLIILTQLMSSRLL